MPNCKLSKIAVLTVCVLSLAVRTQSQGIQVRQITIDSSWHGLGPASKNHLVVGLVGDGFMTEGKAVDTGLVQALITALERPRIEKPEASLFGVTPEWLVQNAETAFQQVRPYDYKTPTPNQRALFQTTFTDLTVINQILTRPSDLPIFDDYPNITASIEFENGERWSASSISGGPFMLPWNLEVNNAKVRTYSPDISRAIAALMPEKTVNRDRISGSEFPGELAEAVLSQIRDQWKALGTGPTPDGAVVK